MKTKNLAHFATRRSTVLAGVFLAMLTGSAYGATFSVSSGNVQDGPIYFIQGEGTTVYGSLANNSTSEDVYWTTSTTTDYNYRLNVANGHGTMKGRETVPKGNGTKDQDADIYNVTFGVKDSFFGKVAFKAEKSVFSITATFSDGSQYTVSDIKAAGSDKHLVLTVDDKLFKTITINSGGGIQQLKQWHVSDVKTVPLPAAAYLFGSALLGMAGIGYRRNKKQA